MEKSIRELRIDSEGIAIISSIHEKIRNILQIDLYTKRDEAEEIFKEYGLSNVKNGSVTLNIIELLSTQDTKARDKLYKHIKKHGLEYKEPEEKSLKIEFNFKKSKDITKKNEDDGVVKATQIDIYGKAKELEDILKNTNIDIKVKMRLLDKMYFTLKKVFGRNSENEIKALNQGNETKQESNKREELLSSLFFDGVEIGDDGKPVEENLQNQPELSNAEGKGIDD